MTPLQFGASLAGSVKKALAIPGAMPGLSTPQVPPPAAPAPPTAAGGLGAAAGGAMSGVSQHVQDVLRRLTPVQTGSPFDQRMMQAVSQPPSSPLIDQRMMQAPPPRQPLPPVQQMIGPR